MQYFPGMSTTLVLACLESVVRPGRWRHAIPREMSPSTRAQLDRTRRELARRVGTSAVLHDGWLEVGASEEAEEREDVIDLALEHGLTAIDTAWPELVTSIPLTDAPHWSLTSATRLLSLSRRGYLVVEGGPSLAFYVQAFLDGEDVRFEAVAGRHLLGHRPRASLDRLRLLGFQRDQPGRPNRVRGLRTGESLAIFSHLATRALLDVYGVSRGETVRLRLAEISGDPVIR